MGLDDDIPDGSSLTLDTNALIYFVEEHDEFLAVIRPVFERVAAGQLQAHVSVVSFIEVLVGPTRDGQAALAERYRELLLNTAGLHVADVTTEIAERAAQLRARYRLRTPDAIIAATTFESGSTHLLTNDSDFRRVEGLRALVVSEYL